LAKECYSMKLELLTNVTVVDDAIRFVSQKSKAKLKCDEEHKEPNEPDYDEDDGAKDSSSFIVNKRENWHLCCCWPTFNILTTFLDLRV
jgi:hypothetical protein